MLKIKAGNIYHDGQKQLVVYDGQISAMHWQSFSYQNNEEIYNRTIMFLDLHIFCVLSWSLYLSSCILFTFDCFVFVHVQF